MSVWLQMAGTPFGGLGAPNMEQIAAMGIQGPNMNPQVGTGSSWHSLRVELTGLWLLNSFHCCSSGSFCRLPEAHAVHGPKVRNSTLLQRMNFSEPKSKRLRIVADWILWRLDWTWARGWRPMPPVRRSKRPWRESARPSPSFLQPLSQAVSLVVFLNGGEIWNFFSFWSAVSVSG